MDDKLTLNEMKVLSSIKFREKYGLEIIATLKNESNTTIYLGSLYNLLANLEKKGYVRSSWGEDVSERGGNRRRYYQITGLGESVLHNEKKSLLFLWKMLPRGA